MIAWIYAIEAVGVDRVKLGRAQNVEERLAALQTGCPVELRVFGRRQDISCAEGELHRRFARSRLHGEWFRFSEIREDLAVYFRKPHATAIDEDSLQVMREFGRREAEAEIAFRKQVRVWWRQL